VNELAESTVNLTAWIWVAAKDYLTVRGDLLEQIKVRFAEAGISMPYPSREVIVRKG
jgi:small conductance mechanosensitive channel